MRINFQLLSPREKEVISLLAEGLSYKDIADQLEISHEVVKKRLQKIYRKLNVKNKVEALNKVKLL